MPFRRGSSRTTISFGVEFEFDFIGPEDRTSVWPHSRYAHITRWGYQLDPTAGAEVSTPVLTDLHTATEQIRAQFTYWITQNNGIVPYSYNRQNRSLGQHIHIGKPRGDFPEDQKRNVARAIARVYPFLATLHAQPIPSHRGLGSSYCFPIYNVNYTVPHNDHLCEISRSHNNTVELRLFDANIPQVSLTVIWVMKAIAENHLNNEVEIDRNTYRNDRNTGLQCGLFALNVPEYLREIKRLANNPQIPDIPCIKEILYICSKRYLTPYQILHLTHASHYAWFRNMYLEPSKFIDNILAIDNIEHRNVLEQWREEAQQIENLDQLIGLSMAGLRELAERLIQETPREVVTTTVRTQTFTRAQVRREIELGRLRITRINMVQGLTEVRVADRISQLLEQHGENAVIPYSCGHIVNSPERYYVAWVYDRANDRVEILGAIAVYRSSGNIFNLVVDRRFRRLGIAQRLLNEVLSLGLPSYRAEIRPNNQAALNLFHSCGFTSYSPTGTTITLVRTNEGD